MSGLDDDVVKLVFIIAVGFTSLNGTLLTVFGGQGVSEPQTLWVFLPVALGALLAVVDIVFELYENRLPNAEVAE